MSCFQKPLQILFEDEAIIVVDKPEWELSVPGKDPTQISTAAKVSAYLGFPAMVVHRLDCATSGVMIFAKTLSSQQALHLSFRKRAVSKIYHALLCTTPLKKSGMIDLPLITDWPARPKQKVDFITGKSALTHWSLLNKTIELAASTETKTTWYPLVELRPKTGRTHQLRLHTAAIHHPILGDRLYADPSCHSQPDNSAPFKRLYLHASELYLPHPTTKRSIVFRAPFDFNQ